MLWFFQRDEQTLRIETRYDNETSLYVARIHHPDGREETEWFQNLETFQHWLNHFEERLRMDRWAARQPGPEFMKDGWPKRLGD